MYGFFDTHFFNEKAILVMATFVSNLSHIIHNRDVQTVLAPEEMQMYTMCHNEEKRVLSFFQRMELSFFFCVVGVNDFSLNFD